MNHTFVTVKGSLSKNKLHDILLKINEKYYNNLFTIINNGNYWEIQYKDYWQYRIQITIDSKRKLHIRPSPGKFSGWMETVFQNEIAFQLKGTCSCEAFSEKWKPVENKYPTYRSYWSMLCEQNILKLEDWQFICYMYEKEIKCWPEELKILAGESPNPNILPNFESVE